MRILLTITALVALTGCTIIRKPAEVGLPPKTVVLTFDDGPNPQDDVTLRLLDVLAKHDVKATFCPIGRNVEEFPDLLRAIHNQGHQIANHSQRHSIPLVESKSQIRRGMREWEVAVGEAIGEEGYTCHFYRPPFGVITSKFERELASDGIAIVPVTFFVRDTLTGPAESDEFVERILANVREQDGGVFVIHEMRYRDHREGSKKFSDPKSGANRSWVPGAVDRIVSELSAEGYRFIRMDELPSES